MIRFLFVLALVFRPATACAAECSPEQLLPATTQIYIRWDGVASHADAYAASARGRMFAGESGKAVDELLQQLNRSAKLALVGEPLLGGTLPEELRQLRIDVRTLLQFPQLLCDKGIVAGFEIRPPTFDLPTLYALAKGDGIARQRLQEPQFQLTVIIPGAADRPELAAGLRLFKRSSNAGIREQVVFDRRVTSIEHTKNECLASWAEGKHAVVAYGNRPIERMVQSIKESGPGITGHPLYKKATAFKEFRTVTRGFFDVSSAVHLVEWLTKSAAPETWPVITATGLAGVKSVCFWDGFEAEESRGVVEIEFVGPRQGLTRMFRPEAKGEVRPVRLSMRDLPPLPADLTRFSAARLDLGAIYQMVPLAFYSESISKKDEEADRRISPEDRLRRRNEDFLQAIDEEMGLKMADLFAALDDKVVTYHAPGDGILNMGQVIAVGVKDQKALARSLDVLTRKLEGRASKEIALTKRDCLGIEVNEFVVKDSSPLTMSYAICDKWLVIGFQPQPVRGFIYRVKGKLPVWKPDARTARTLARIPDDRCVIQVADPRPSLQWLLGSAPIVAGLFNGKNGPAPLLDPGMFPQPAEANKHLFPNVCWCRDDGKTMRWESRDSLWMPLEFMGLELLSVSTLSGARLR